MTSELPCLLSLTSFFSFREVFIVEPIVSTCKVHRNLSVHVSVICRRGRTVPGVELKVEEVGRLLEPQVAACCAMSLLACLRDEGL